MVELIPIIRSSANIKGIFAFVKNSRLKRFLNYQIWESQIPQMTRISAIFNPIYKIFRFPALAKSIARRLLNSSQFVTKVQRTSRELRLKCSAD